VEDWVFVIEHVRGRGTTSELLTRDGPGLPCEISVMTIDSVHLKYCITAAGNAISSQLSSSCQGRKSRHYGRFNTVKITPAWATLPPSSAMQEDVQCQPSMIMPTYRAQHCNEIQLITAACNF
jgi:hypothetical protein